MQVCLALADPFLDGETVPKVVLGSLIFLKSLEKRRPII